MYSCDCMLVGFGHILCTHVHVYTHVLSSLIYTDTPFLVSFSLVMISRGLFPRLQWWGKERGGDDGGRGRGIREEGMFVGELTKATSV